MFSDLFLRESPTVGLQGCWHPAYKKGVRDNFWYNTVHTHIHRVRAHQDNGDTIGAATEYERATIVKAIKGVVTFVTIFSSSGNWQKVQSVYIIKVNGVEYIKTVDNGKKQDNLENLPEF